MVVRFGSKILKETSNIRRRSPKRKEEILEAILPRLALVAPPVGRKETLEHCEFQNFSSLKEA